MIVNYEMKMPLGDICFGDSVADFLGSALLSDGASPLS